MGAPEEKKKVIKEKKNFKEIIENFPNLRKNINVNHQEVLQIQVG